MIPPIVSPVTGSLNVTVKGIGLSRVVGAGSVTTTVGATVSKVALADAIVFPFPAAS